MGLVFEKAEKNAFGYYVPTSVCQLDENGFVGSCNNVNDAPKALKDFLKGKSYHKINDPVNNKMMRVLLPVSKDYKSFYFPIENDQKVIPTANEVMSAGYLASLSEAEFQTKYKGTLPTDIKNLPIPDGFCLDMDPCLSGVNCCKKIGGIATTPNVMGGIIVIVAIISSTIFCSVMMFIFMMRRR